MVGRNDVSLEVFAQNDAQAVLSFAQANPDIHLLSLWAVGRDAPAPAKRKSSRAHAAESRNSHTDFPAFLRSFE